MGSYCSLFIVFYMSIGYLKVTVSLMRAIILERLSFQEAYSRYVRPDRQIYQSLRALHRALDMEGVDFPSWTRSGGRCRDQKEFPC